MLSWQIDSFESVGPIAFGETRDTIRSVLGSGFRSFRKTQDENETDAYDSLGVHIYYDDSNCVEFVELFTPAEPSFESVSLVGQKAEDVVGKLRELGYEGDQDDVGYNYDGVGIGLTINGNVVEGVGVFREGYYD